MTCRIISRLLFYILSFSFISNAQYDISRFNAYNQKLYTFESEHFRFHAPMDLKHVAEKTARILERLYPIYYNVYSIKLPQKTEVLIFDTEESNGWADDVHNMIAIWANDIDWNLRGTTNWLENVVAHEYAHLISLSTSQKTPSWLPYVQFGYFNHPNTIYKSKNDSTRMYGTRIEAVHIFPMDIIPPCFFEGIAQYESARNKGDSWDTHREMILRTLAASNKLLTWDHMCTFAGKGDDYEKTYDHGFSLVKYIAETYGYEKVAAILRESQKPGRINFDRSIQAVLGISAKKLYQEWSASLKQQYQKQLTGIGKQVYGRKLNKNGFENFWPRFGRNDSKVYFLSNDKQDFASLKQLYSYSFADTIKEDKRIKVEMPQVDGFYSIDKKTGLIAFSSMKSKKSILPPSQGGIPVKDLFLDALPSDVKKNKLFHKKTERQVTVKQSVFHSSFSPQGNRIAFSKHSADEYFLGIMDTTGKVLQQLYPDPDNPELKISTIYSLDWSPSGDYIALSYIDRDTRKIGLYNVKDTAFFVFCDTAADQRDPRFGFDGKTLYFSSDRTGIFNIYRYNFATETLQRITNVSGGAFTPDISADEKKLVFANYDPSGYGIYCIDSVTVLSEEKISADLALKKRTGYKQNIPVSRLSPEHPYNYFPRKFVLVPVLWMQQVLAQNNDPFKGITNAELGCILFLNDPLMKNEIGCYLFSETFNPFKLFDRQKIISRSVAYDLGVFATTRRLPLDVSLLYAQRAIPGQDQFSHDLYGKDTIELLNFKLNPQIIQLRVSQKLKKNLSLNLFADYYLYRVLTEIDEQAFDYDPARGFRLGTYAVAVNPKRNSVSNISPTGFYTKLKYEFSHQNLLDNEKALVFENGLIKENYNNFRYNQITGKFFYGFHTPWYDRHDISLSVEGTALALTESCKKELKEAQNSSEYPYLHPLDLPSFFKPGTQLPGYIFYYRDTARIYKKDASGTITDTIKLPTDTILLSGNAYVTAALSYRFPLSPRLIDKKIGFIYLERLYGAVNFGGGTSLNQLSEYKNIKRENILLYTGLELRFEAQTFNRYPFSLSTRWDYGMDKKAPIGGHKFFINLGFEFQNWDILDDPDGIRKTATRRY